ncbi:hypothetical protein ACO0LL_21845 [Undibacterium sp. TC4M20W]|uniref:hypothetical protein n=1 Tax=unclassified Undibacterium TaxID=2630295 RepID=UPI003BF1871B
MKDLSRALRRHHAARLKKKRQYYFYSWKEKLSALRLGMVLHTPTTCSCYMCGNPRKYFKERTMQERRWMQVVE